MFFFCTGREHCSFCLCWEWQGGLICYSAFSDLDHLRFNVAFANLCGQRWQGCWKCLLCFVWCLQEAGYKLRPNLIVTLLMWQIKYCYDFYCWVSPPTQESAGGGGVGGGSPRKIGWVSGWGCAACFPETLWPKSTIFNTLSLSFPQLKIVSPGK